MKEIYKKINEALINDEKPSIYMNKLMREGRLKEYPLSMIGKLKDIQQNLKFHPEGNVWNHLMMVIDEGAKVREYSNDKRSFMMALLLHDVGKVPTTKIRNGKWTSYDHDIEGEKLAKEFLSFFGESDEFIKKVCPEVRYHMQSLFVTNNLPYADIDGMINKTDINEIALITFSDRMGRGNMTKEKYNETRENINKFLDIICSRYSLKHPEIPVLK